ncbi:TRAP transporter substrate-binding protein [Eoetvoesiella caeni]|uniref:Secreted protein n=1 Tax=Eoetvoesiella caeni TaxID=645616 RepID=A0A366HG90_9BURK|nr:TRAP transporter substrate-binding protein [Eoetvoesiella caeni]MCI2807759.1 TRAP transporter substrate-binding protein [Eoetvoesiella caeni]NYT54236.1 TRAP transporter substrate-binding protein [Eoetvoesiella caeni]RBP41674.1 secreted protein [Eoetvoesiella caeni]
MNTRRKFLGAAAAAAVTVLMSPAVAEQVYELKVSSYLPPSHTINREITRWAADLKQKSNGRLILKLFPSSQMGPVNRQFDLARTGVADISYVLQGATPGRFPLTELAQYPTLIPNGKVGSQALMDIKDLLEKEYTGVKVLYFMSTPPIPLLTSTKEITTIGQMHGLRIRHPGTVYASLISALGATPVGVAPSEVADALNKGTIDGTLMSYEGAESFQLGTDLKYATAFNAGVVTFAMVMNPKSYAGLPADLQKLIDETTGNVGAKRVGTDSDEADERGLVYMRKHGVKVVSLGEADSKAYEKITSKLINDKVAALEEKGLPGKVALQRLKEAIAARAKGQ